MSTQAYTSIPPTTVLAYWQVSAINGCNRCVTFVPKDKELHRQLKLEAWNKIQARLPAKLRSKVRIANELEELGHIPKPEYIPGSPRQRFSNFRV